MTSRSVLSALWIPLLALGVVAAPAPAAAATPAAGSAIKDCADCPEMIYIPAGSFMMGATAEEQATMDEKPEPLNPKSTPQHRVTIGKAFYIGKYEVTRALFRVFANETRLVSPARCILTDKSYDGNSFSQVLERRNWVYPPWPVTDNHPVACTNWYDAKAYAEWLTKKTGHKYRLPTEAEWEYAARAGTTTHWYWGNDYKVACEYANLGDRSFAVSRGFKATPANAASWDPAHLECDTGFPYMSPVGSFKPNPWGLYDMVGNTWEILEDCWHENFNGAPTDGSAWIEGSDCRQRVLRGDGNIGDPYSWSYIAHRYGAFADEHRSNTHGFRLVREE